MRPRNEAARAQLTTTLARRAGASAADLATQLKISVPTLHRLLREQGSAVIATGAARRSRYALRRAVRGDAAPHPVYAVDAQGRAEQVADLALIQVEVVPRRGEPWPPIVVAPRAAPEAGCRAWDAIRIQCVGA